MLYYEISIFRQCLLFSHRSFVVFIVTLNCLPESPTLNMRFWDSSPRDPAWTYVSVRLLYLNDLKCDVARFCVLIVHNTMQMTYFLWCFMSVIQNIKIFVRWINTRHRSCLILYFHFYLVLIRIHNYIDDVIYNIVYQNNDSTPDIPF